MVRTVACFLFFSGCVWAQSSAQINGTVRDQTGAIIAAAQIIATNTETGFKRGTVIDAGGAYTLPNLPVGPYRLEAGATGFRTYVQTGILLQVADSLIINPSIPIIAGISPVPAREGFSGNGSILEVDRRHNWNLSAAYLTPRLANRSLRLVASGWIVRVLSGDFISANAGVDQIKIKRYRAAMTNGRSRCSPMFMLPTRASGNGSTRRHAHSRQWAPTELCGQALSTGLD